MPRSSFRLNLEYLRFSWFLLLGFLFFSSGFSLTVSFVFKPPLISKYFAYYLRVIGKEMLRKKIKNNVVIFWWQCTCSNVSISAVYWWLSLMFCFKIVTTLHKETNSVVMCFRKQICFIETFCKTVLHVYMCNYILKQIHTVGSNKENSEFEDLR